MEKPYKHYLSQGIKVNTNSDKLCWWDLVTMAHNLCDLPPQTHNVIMKKISDKSQLRDSLQNTSPVFLKTVKVI